MKINIDKIIVGQDRRDINSNRVTELAESIKQSGLINPITIGADNYLIAGLHRLEACRIIGITEIEVIKKDCIYGEDAFTLLEIDENLMRNELTVIERSLDLAKRKAIYERLYPESKKESNNKKSTADSAVDFFSDDSKTTADSAVVSFATDTRNRIITKRR